MIIRDFLPEDYQQIFDLWVELDMGGLERGDTLEVLLQTIDKGGKLLIMEEPVKHSIIGSSWITNDGRRLFLHHFGIKKDYQGRGLGMKLAIASLKFIKEKGMQVKLEVHKENIAAKKLYEKTGFNAFTDYDIYMIRKPHEIDPADFDE